VRVDNSKERANCVVTDVEWDGKERKKRREEWVLYMICSALSPSHCERIHDQRSTFYNLLCSYPDTVLFPRALEV
jgi:hypothetical protein